MNQITYDSKYQDSTEINTTSQEWHLRNDDKSNIGNQSPLTPHESQVSATPDVMQDK